METSHVKMTANRLILLLAAYRGTLDDELRTGTRQGDLAHLIKMGWLDPQALSTVGARPTEAGAHLVKTLLATVERSAARLKR